MMNIDVNELRGIAQELATRAGKMILERRCEGAQIADVKSSITDIVTYADREAEAFLRQELAVLRPEDSFLGEESGYVDRGGSLTWIVDPIDGTVNYARNVPYYAVSIAVVENQPVPEKWRALAGAVVNPVLGEVFSAAPGGGATCNDEAINVSKIQSLDRALLATGFGYGSQQRTQQAQRLSQIIGNVADIRRFGACSLDLCAVAQGTLDAYVEEGLSPWDHAAGVLIVSEAGARVGGRQENMPNSELIVAANTNIFESLNAHVQALYAG